MGGAKLVRKGIFRVNSKPCMKLYPCMPPLLQSQKKWLCLNTCYLQFVYLDTSVSIGDVSIKLKKPLNPELVPIKYCKYKQSNVIIFVHPLFILTYAI
jgi:hypothetical protein